MNREIHHADVYAISRKEVPSPTKKKKSGVPDCSATNVALSLTPAASSFGVGGSMDFTTDIKYDGSSKVGCLVDISASNVVLTIKSGDDVIWKSNVCPVDADYRLLAKGDEVKQTITWPERVPAVSVWRNPPYRRWIGACIRRSFHLKGIPKPSPIRSA